MTVPRITIASYQLAYDLLGSAPGLAFKHVISINNPEEEPPRPLKKHPGRHLVLHFHDLTRDSGRSSLPYAPEMVLPSAEDVSKILDFAEDIEEDHDVLVHCAAGISRSSAAALGIIASKVEPRSAREAIKELLDVKRTIHPNRDMVTDIDKQLGYEGRLVQAYGLAFNGGELIWMPPELENLDPDAFED
jgi:predicted protein tyrosine phosphatase